MSNRLRVAPRQDRSARRLAGFLDAAAETFVDAGYEAATMTEIAERSGSSIGALYNYFPDKQSIAATLMKQYAEELEAHWRPLIDQAPNLGHAEFADLFVERITEFVRERPAFVKLSAAPIRFRRDPAARKASRVAMANAFRAKNPLLSDERSWVAANVVLQLVGGMMRVLEESEPKLKPVVVDEFKNVLTSYLETILASQSTLG